MKPHQTKVKTHQQNVPKSFSVEPHEDVDEGVYDRQSIRESLDGISATLAQAEDAISSMRSVLFGDGEAKDVKASGSPNNIESLCATLSRRSADLAVQTKGILDRL